MARFVKGHGTENDFVLLPDPDGELELTDERVQRLCDRRAGIGADGVLRVVRSAAHPEAASTAGEAEWFMDYRNADGSAVEMCGNGIRVFARFLVDEGWAEPGDLPVVTRDGVKQVRVGREGDVTVDMGPARLPGTDRTVRVGTVSWPATEVDIGNPHAVVFVDRLADAGKLREPPAVEPAFPQGANVEFVESRGPSHVAMRVHERGVGETRSCGTGACAVMVATALRDGAGDGPAGSDGLSRTYVVEVPGGQLTVSRRADGHLELTGPAVLVADGEVSAALWWGKTDATTAATA
ncbi:MAG TPA: diaminopimelate epimerase [Actinomycetes bacterium]|nr:diaminopimelate epimerase [Actinomycetes bacterium]